VEPLLRRIRNEMTAAGMTVESAKGECNLGQHEIAFRYDEVVTTADQHSIYKTGAKEIAAQEGMSLTFMAKFDEREGNSCHIHLSLRDADGRAVFAADPGAPTVEVGSHHGHSAVFDHFIAGVLAPCASSPLVRTEHQQLQAIRPRLLRPDVDRLGR